MDISPEKPYSPFIHLLCARIGILWAMCQTSHHDALGSLAVAQTITFHKLDWPIEEQDWSYSWLMDSLSNHILNKWHKRWWFPPLFQKSCIFLELCQGTTVEIFITICLGNPYFIVARCENFEYRLTVFGTGISTLGSVPKWLAHAACYYLYVVPTNQPDVRNSAMLLASNNRFAQASSTWACSWERS